MKEGEEANEASSPISGAAGAGANKPTLSERRGLDPGALHVYTGADGTSFVRAFLGTLADRS